MGPVNSVCGSFGEESFAAIRPRERAMRRASVRIRIVSLLVGVRAFPPIPRVWELRRFPMAEYRRFGVEGGRFSGRCTVGRPLRGF